MTDPNTDDWLPSASLAALRQRAGLMQSVRAFFQERDLLEVETPLLSAAAVTDPQLESLAVSYEGAAAPADGRLYLHTSPEFPMKRLLAAGSGPIWQICRVVRSGERGRRHNPEFTMLEWYRPGWNHRQLMDEVAALIERLVGRRPVRRQTYAELFAPLDLDPHVADRDRIVRRAAELGLGPPEGLNRDALLDLILGVRIAPALGQGRLDFIEDFPATQAALARIRPGSPPVAERFECFLDGMEIANGFHELGDAEEQRQRFQRDLGTRHEQGRATPPMDEHLLAALEHGLPDCAGVALGLDRLFMVALGATRIDQVMAFPIERA